MKSNGCNADMPKGTIGTHSTRMNPNSFARNNLSMGGVNKDIPGKPSQKAGSVGQGKYRNDAK
jgi:hypothetical protein